MKNLLKKMNISEDQVLQNKELQQLKGGTITCGIPYSMLFHPNVPIDQQQYYSTICIGNYDNNVLTFCCDHD